MMEQINWAPEHSAALREGIARGMSFSQIARTINGKFGTTYSRNSAIGRAKRLGLAAAPRAQGPLFVKQLLKRFGKTHQGSTQKAEAPRPMPEKTKRIKLRCVEIEPRHLDVTELERGDCRYPYGGDIEGEAITFCGGSRRQGSSYCTPHFHLSRNPGVPSEPEAIMAWLRLVEAA